MGIWTSIGDALKTSISPVQDQIRLLQIVVLIGPWLQNRAALVLNAMVNFAAPFRGKPYSLLKCVLNFHIRCYYMLRWLFGNDFMRYFDQFRFSVLDIDLVFMLLII